MRPSSSEAARWLAGFVGAWLLAACGTLTIPQERRLGDEYSREIRREVVLLRDAEVNNYVSGIGTEIVRAAGPQPFEYRFYVVESEEINAFALPAGHIYVHTETILKARNASELAGVIAHEVGHVAKRHIAHNYNRQRNTGIAHQLGVIAASTLGGSAAGSAANLGGGLLATAYLNRFGREAEAEADAFAVDVLPEAGYDPRGLVSFFQTLQHEGGSQPLTFLSDHPATDDRIAATSARIQEKPTPQGLRADDGGRLEIIQRRVRLLTGDLGDRRTGRR
jgi:predicted Zn-dependent protease